MRRGTRIEDPETGMVIEYPPVDDPYNVVKNMNERLRAKCAMLGLTITTTEELS